MLLITNINCFTLRCALSEESNKKMRALLQLQALTTRLSLSSSSSTFLRAKTLSLNPNSACTQNSQVRRIWSSTPVCMGRRSSKIAGRKVYACHLFDQILLPFNFSTSISIFLLSSFI